MNKNKNFDILLLVTFVSSMFYYMVIPYINKMLYSNVGENIIAIMNMVICVFAIIINFSWAKIPKKLFKYFPHLCILEGILNSIICIMCIYTKNIVLYYILDGLIAATVSKNLGCGYNLFKIVRYNTEEKRNTFDNLNGIMSCSGIMVGSALSMVFSLPFEALLIVYTITNALDNITYAIIFIYLKKNGRLSDNKNIVE